ncbi:DUF3710 domain-containing protein [Aestuariimicrobium sp. p3-SID1156]|uniref:DUF3710 domain-containing protein n=1 Tax=Aestuariimicrobium sp. p3-SID1156 TaxID=2916038 RepID=UPI0037C02D9A
MFGRKKKQKLEEEDVLDPAELETDEDLEDGELEEEELDDTADEGIEGEETDDDDNSDDEGDADEGEELDQDELDEDELDEDELEDEDAFDDDSLEADQELREDGPFDIDEVDLDADEIDRLDFGSLILTPFDEMQLQLQVDQTSGQVQSVLVVSEQSALEVALFAAPARSSMIKDVADDMVASTVAAGGESEMLEGPFGPEIRRIIPVEAPDGEQAWHVSRTWFAQGPRWLLRGVLMGEAAMQDGFEGAGELLFEFFCNVVVRRGEEPMVPGDLIPMQLPEELIQADES